MFIYPNGFNCFVGVDEVGRGPLCCDVVTAAVILDPNRPILGLNDSKKLSDKKRQFLFKEIQEKALAFAIGRANVQEIDELNILQATFLAMQRAVADLPIRPDAVLVDGNKTPQFNLPSFAIVKGDGLVPEISAASILAKVIRDNELLELDAKYPRYGFAKHKGYPTAQHLQALEQFGFQNGLIQFYRKSFSPIKKLLNK